MSLQVVAQLSFVQEPSQGLVVLEQSCFPHPLDSIPWNAPLPLPPGQHVVNIWQLSALSAIGSTRRLEVFLPMAPVVDGARARVRSQAPGTRAMENRRCTLEHPLLQHLGLGRVWVWGEGGEDVEFGGLGED